MEPEQSNRRKKQWLLIVLCGLAYSFAYAGRYSYNANIAPIMEFYGVTRAEAGLVSTFFFFAYGVGQFVHAVFCKLYPKRIVIPGVLILSAAINLALFFQPPFEIIKYLWLLNGICQSLLWPTLILTLSEVLEESMMKRAVLTMSFSVLIGTFLAYGGSALFNLGNAFQVSFLFGAILMIAVGAVWFFSYRTLTAKADTKTDEPLQPIEKQKAAGQVIAGTMVGLLVVCALFAAVDNFVKDGLNTWTPVILKEQFGFGDSVSMVMTLVLPFFGVFGSMLALQVHRWIKDFRTLIGFFYLLLSGCLCGVMLSMHQNAVMMFLICLGFISCLAHGINSVLTSIMPLAMREKINSGFLAGAMNASCYIGSTASAYGLGKIADNEGWNAVIRILLVTSVISVLLAGGCSVIGRIKRRKNNDGNRETFPTELKNEQSNRSYIIATWNIGHFSGGKKYCSTITGQEYTQKSKAFRDFISSLGADILSLNEYSDELIRNDPETDARKVILSDYPNITEGERRYYSCNVLCSRIPLEHTAVREFACNSGKWGERILNPANGQLSARQYYYIEADLPVNGKNVKVICTHLAFLSDPGDRDELVEDQIDELIEKYGACEHVVMMGDWNSNCFSFFRESVEKGGFRLANECANAVTCPPDLSLDNVIWKGVTIDGFEIRKTDLSDHYAVVCRITAD